MPKSLLAKQGASSRAALSKNLKPSAPSVRAARSRSTVVTRAMIDQSSFEVTAALTALISSGAAVFSLASIIRQANGFDARDKAFMASTKTITTVPAAVTVEEIIAEKTVEPIVAEKKAPVVEPIKKEIATPVVAAAAVTTPPDVSSITKVEEKKSFATTPVVAATAAPTTPAIKKVEKKAEEALVTPTIATKPAEIGEPIVFNFENTPEAISVSSQDEDIATTRVTEPTMPKADPVVAAAVLEAMTADAPVGITAPGSNNNNNNGGGSEISTPTEEPALELVGAMAAPTSAAEAMEAAREYEARLARVLADAKLDTYAPTETSTAQKQRSQRLVTITEQYQEKIESLWASYEVKKTQEAILLSKQEKITMDLAALDAAQQAQEEAAKADNKLAMAMQKVQEIFAAIVAFIMAMVAKATGGRFGGAGTPASA